MNSTCGSTPPNLTPDLPNRSTFLHKTLGIVGTPHGHSIAKIWSTKTCETERNQGNHTKNGSNPRAKENPKSSPFAHRFGRGDQGKRTTKGSSIHPHQIRKRKASKSLQENRQERDPKITKKDKRERHI
jgi:hypothetical protein